MGDDAHLAHAIATFSELGIATGLVWISDFVEIRSKLHADLIVAEESLRVINVRHRAQAKEFDGLISVVILIMIAVRPRIFSWTIKFLLGLLHWAPYICIVLGTIALLGLSVLPPMPERYSSYISDLHVYLILSILSFTVILLLFVAKMAKLLINWYVLKDVRVE